MIARNTEPNPPSAMRATDISTNLTSHGLFAFLLLTMTMDAANPKRQIIRLIIKNVMFCNGKMVALEGFQPSIPKASDFKSDVYSDSTTEPYC